MSMIGATRPVMHAAAVACGWIDEAMGVDTQDISSKLVRGRAMITVVRKVGRGGAWATSPCGWPAGVGATSVMRSLSLAIAGKTH
jgi:hypothetical protein